MGNYHDILSGNNGFPAGNLVDICNLARIRIRRCQGPAVPGQGVQFTITISAAASLANGHIVSVTPLLSLAATSSNAATIGPDALADQGDDISDKKSKFSVKFADRAGAGVYVVKQLVKDKPSGESGDGYHISTGLPSGKVN